MYVMLGFDTEDIYYPPEADIDDIPGWLAETMTEVGVTGTFYTFGEKAESLLERGRRDVLEKMARHEIASHQRGNRYPLLPQVVEGKGWADGMAAVREYEDWVTERLVKAFGKEPVAFSRHNHYFAPQHVAVAGERGLPYKYLPLEFPTNRQPVWYAGTLCFNSGNLFGGFDRVYSRDELFERKLAALDAFVADRLAAGEEAIGVMGCHPVSVMSRDWFERLSLSTGKPRTPADLGWRFAAKPREEEARAKVNFRRLCVYLKEHPDLEVVGIGRAAELFSTRPARVDRDALVHYALAVAASAAAPVVPLHDAFSPAELLCALADSLVHAEEAGDLPDAVDRRDVMGPTERPVVAQEVISISRKDFVGVCRRVVGAVEETGHLPANVAVEGGRLGVGQILGLAARACLARARYDLHESLSVPGATRYPDIAHEFDATIRRTVAEHWGLPLDFSVESLAEHARLQTWTLKPAWLRPPQGPPVGRPYSARCRVE